MESSNLYHSIQDQLGNFSSLATPSCYGAATSCSWIPNGHASSGLHRTIDDNTHQNVAAHQWLHSPQHGKIKDEYEFSKNPFTKLSESIMDRYSSIEDLDQTHAADMKNEQKDSSSAGEFVPTFPRRRNYSHIFPIVNLSDLNDQTSLEISSSFNSGFQAIDLLASARLKGNISRFSHENFGWVKESHPSDELSMHRPPSSASKVSSITSGAMEVKRSYVNNVKATKPRSTTNKSRLESRACPPFKVRKEKLGDRIAALQQLVAPFGKTDTASVLMEAIGYIKFLENQVETLIVPYMRSSRNRINRSKHAMTEDDGELRRRGLCLAPFSTMSYVTDVGSSSGCGMQ